MTQNQLITSVLFLLLSSTVYADTSVSYAPGPPGMIPTGSVGKKAGDIISLQTDDTIAATCDFNKQIVVTKTSVLCVYNGK